MNKIELGQSGLKCSRLGYGCWRIVSRVEHVELTPDREEDAQKAVLAAVDAGYTLFDHADIYSDGAAETVFGKVLKKKSSLRSQILIATKCGIRKAGDNSIEKPYRYDSSSQHIILSCESSLKRLQTDYIDIYQIHRPDFLTNPQEVADAFVKLQQQGKVRHFGLSNASPSFFAMLQKYCPMKLIVNQVEISLKKLNTLFDGTLEHCLTEKITPLAWSPLGGGSLAFQGPIDLNEPGHAKRILLRECLDYVARERKVSRANIALAWLLKHPAGIVPLIGSADPKNIKELTKAAEINLSREEWYYLMEGANGQRLP
jgi:predicted oxidoreductase